MLISIGNVCNFSCLATPSNLKNPDIIEINKQHPFTHYIICQINRLRIRKESIKHSENYIEFTISQQINDFDWEEYRFKMLRKNGDSSLTMSVEGNKITVSNSHGGSNSFDNTFLFLDAIGSSYGWHEALEKLLLLDVQYIGKTEIKENYLRFKNHEKIVDVSNEIIEHRTNKEIIVKLLSFQPPFTNAMVIPGVESDDSRKDWHVGGGLIENMPIDDWKSIIEGALIKYFQPQYNINLKDNYPSKYHSSYKYFYDQNIRSIIVELHEEYMAHKTGNTQVPYTRIRMIQYPLNSDDCGTYLMDNDNQMMDFLHSKYSI